MMVTMVGGVFDCDLSKRHPRRSTQRIVVVVNEGCMRELPTVYAIDDLYSSLASSLEHGLEGYRPSSFPCPGLFTPCMATD